MRLLHTTTQITFLALAALGMSDLVLLWLDATGLDSPFWFWLSMAAGCALLIGLVAAFIMTEHLP